MRPTATCELWVDGTRIPDTGDALTDGMAVALTDLKMTWGRDGQNEQPGPASCSFEILDPVGRDNALDIIHVGSDVEVWAEGFFEGSGSGWVTTNDDPTLQTWPLGDVDASRYAATDAFSSAAIIVEDGSRVIAATTGGNPSGAQITVPPRRFSPPGDLPDAWDSITKWTPGGYPWQITVVLMAPVGTSVNLSAGNYPSPYSTAWGSVVGGPTIPGTGNWSTISGTFAPPGAGWMGARVGFSRVPNRWQDQGSTTWAAAVGTWETFGRVRIARVMIERPEDTSFRRTLVFSGEISDITLTPYGDAFATSITATAMDLGAELGNTVIGDTPWSVQTVDVRADRICELAGITSTPPIRIDDPLGALQVSYRDVDAQPAYGLLQDLAQTAGGVLWVATHELTGPFLWIENPAERVAVREFNLMGGGAPVVDATNTARNPNLESGTVAGWFSNDVAKWTLAATSASPISGTTSALSTRLAASPSVESASLYLFATPDTPAAGVPGQTFTMSLDIRTERPNRKAYGYLMFLDSSWGAVGNSPQVEMTLTNGAVGRFVASAVAPPGTAWVYPVVGVMDTMGTNAPTGERVWFDNFRLGGADYFDGSTPASGTHTYRWTGTVNASASERLTTGGVIVITGADSTRGAALMSACDLLEDAAAWRQDTADVVTVVAVTWLEQSVNDEGEPETTERTVTVTDTDAVATYGTRRLSVGTELIAAADATDMASRLLALAREVQWRIDGLTFDTRTMLDDVGSVSDDSREAALLDMLGGTSRMGLGITLVDMPPYAPGGDIQSVYLEGGSYSFSDGEWVLALTTTPAAGQGHSASWAEMATTNPAWRWNQWSPDVEWTDTFGVAA